MVVITSKQFILRPFQKGDEKSLAKNINNKKIYKNTLNIPYPYTLRHAKDWVEKNIKDNKKKNPTTICFVIDINGEVCGSVSLEIKGHKAQLGYWLAEKKWGNGIMTTAVKLINKYGFEGLKLRRIYAYVFLFNKASIRVLEKSGYKREGILKKNVKKDNKFIDNYVFAKVK